MKSEQNIIEELKYNFSTPSWESKYNEHINYFKLNEIYFSSICSKNDEKKKKSIYDKIKFYNSNISCKNIESLFENWTYKNEEDALRYSNWKFRKEIIRFICENI